MRISTIIYLSQQYFLLAIPIVFFVISIFLFLYFFLYKKILNGDKKLNKTKLLIWSLFLIYTVIVLGATLISRESNPYNDYIDIYVFELYKNIWYGHSSFELRNLIYNILMFIPFGFMLPLLLKKCEKFHITYILVFCITLSIEISQLITKRGLFEINDIINNTLGGVIGYGLIMIILSFTQKEKNTPKYKLIFSVFCYQIPLIISVVFFTSILINTGFVI